MIYRYFIVLPTTSPYGYSSSNWRRRIEIVSLIICFITFSVLTCPQLRCSATLSRYSATLSRYLEDADYKSACANGIGAENGAGITNPLVRTVSGRRTVPGLQIHLREWYRGGERCRDYISACANGIGVENGAGITYPLARTASGQRDGRQTPDADFAAGGVVTPCAFAAECHLRHLDAIGGKACGVVGGGRDILLLKIF